MVEKWKLALKEFLKKYEEDDDIIGAILCGSYAYGTYNENSDINVYLISKNSATYTESGCDESNSYIISYHVENFKSVKSSMELGFNVNLFDVINMFAYGKIIYDLDGSVKKLQDIALEYIDKPVNNINRRILDLNNQILWNEMKELKTSLKEKRLDFNKIYYFILDKTYYFYCNYLSIPLLPKEKIYKLLTDNNYREKNHIFKLPEDEFIKLYLKCYEVGKPEIMYENINNLIDYYYKKQGGFNIRNFKIRTEEKHDKY